MRFGARWDFSCASAQGTLSRFVKHLLRCRCGHGLSSILRLGLARMRRHHEMPIRQTQSLCRVTAGFLPAMRKQSIH